MLLHKMLSMVLDLAIKGIQIQNRIKVIKIDDQITKCMVPITLDSSTEMLQYISQAKQFAETDF